MQLSLKIYNELSINDFTMDGEIMQPKFINAA